MGRGFLDNRVFRAMNRLDRDIAAVLDRSWLGRFRRRMGARLARPYPAMSELSMDEQELLGWVHVERASVSDPRLVPYLFGRVEAARRALLWFGLPMFVVFGIALVLSWQTAEWSWGGALIIPMVSPALHTWSYFSRAKRVAAAHVHLVENEERPSAGVPTRRGPRGRTS